MCLQRRILLLCASVSLWFNAGCDKEPVRDDASGTISPKVTAEPTWIVRSPDAAAAAPWYQEMLCVFPEKPAEAELPAKLVEAKPAAEQAIQHLLVDIQNKIEEQRSPGNKWSIL